MCVLPRLSEDECLSRWSAPHRLFRTVEDKWERWVRRVRSSVFSSTKVKQDVTSVLLLCGAWGAGGGGYKPGDDIRISRLTAQAVPPSDRDVRELTRVRQIVIKRSAQSRDAFSAPVPHLCIFSNLLELSRTLFNSTPLLSLLIDYSFMLMLLQIPHREKPRVKVKVKLSFQDKCIYEITPFMSVFSTSSRRTSRHAHQLNRFAFQFLFLSVQHKLIFSKNKIQNKNNYNKK